VSNGGGILPHSKKGRAVGRLCPENDREEPVTDRCPRRLGSAAREGQNVANEGLGLLRPISWRGE